MQLPNVLLGLTSWHIRQSVRECNDILSLVELLCISKLNGAVGPLADAVAVQVIVSVYHIYCRQHQILLELDDTFVAVNFLASDKIVQMDPHVFTSPSKLLLGLIIAGGFHFVRERK